MADQKRSIPLRLQYEGAKDVPILVANQFVTINYEGNLVLIAGQISPPVLLGSEEEKLEEARRLPHMPVKVVARLAMTLGRARELTDLLQAWLKQIGVEPE